MRQLVKLPLAVITIAVSIGCASHQVLYTPDPSYLLGRLSVDEATTTLQSFVGDFCPDALCHALSSIKIVDKKTLVLVGVDGTAVKEIPLDRLKVAEGSGGLGDVYAVYLNKKWKLFPKSLDELSAKRVADALVLMQALAKVSIKSTSAAGTPSP